MKKVKFPIFAVFTFILGLSVLFLGAKKFSSQIGRKSGCPCSNPETADGEFYPNEQIAYYDGKRIDARLIELGEP